MKSSKHWAASSFIRRHGKALVFLITLSASILLSDFVTSPNVGGYRYAVTREEWLELDTAQQISSCQIPRFRLSFMTTDQLIDSLLDSPAILSTILSSGADPYAELSTYSNIPGELQRRKDAPQKLLYRFEQSVKNKTESADSLYLYLITRHPVYQKQYSSEEIERWEQCCEQVLA